MKYIGKLKLVGILFIAIAFLLPCNAQEISVSNTITSPLDHTIWVSDSANLPSEAIVELNITDLVNQERKPITVVLAIDCSGSMQTSDPMDDRIEAAKKFVDIMAADRVNDKYGVVLWNGGIIEKLETTNNIDIVKSSIDKAVASDGTCIWEALNASDSLLQGATTDKKIVVLFSDGYDNCQGSPDFVEKAQDMKFKGITIYTVGLGQSNIADLEAIAPGQYFHVRTSGGIETTFEKVLARLKPSLENVEAIYQLPNGIEAYGIPDGAVQIFSNGINTIKWPIGPMYYQQTETISFKVKSNHSGTYLLAMPSDSIVSYEVPSIGQEQATIPSAELDVEIEANLFYSARARGGKASDEFATGYRITASKDIRWSKFGCQDIFINITTPKIPCNRTVVFATDASGSTLQGPYEDSMMGGVENALNKNPTVQYARVDWDFTRSDPDYASPTFQKASNWGNEWANHHMALYETDGTEYVAGLNRALTTIVSKKNADTPFDKRITDYMVIFLTGKSEIVPTGVSSAVSNAISNHIPVYTVGLDIDASDPATSWEASVLRDQISIPTGGNFVPAGNSRASVDAIVSEILSDSCINREAIPAAGSVTVVETIYPYFRVLGTEPSAKSIKHNTDGSTTVVFDLGNLPGAARKSLVVHTSIDFFKLPVDVNNTRTSVDFSPDTSTQPSAVTYTSIVDNTTKHTISLPEGELSIFCGEPCNSAAEIPAAKEVQPENNTTRTDTIETEDPKPEPGFEFLFAATGISLAGYLYRRRPHRKN